MAETTAQLGKDSPIKNFRPNLWKHLDHETNSLQLDLFWPVKSGEEDDGVYVDVPKDEDGDIIAEEACLPLEDLKPILSFRKLSVLHLTGMMRSYQSVIWEVVWSNPGLVILDIEMALEPLFNEDTKHPNRIIDTKWQVFPTIEPSLSDLTVDSVASKDVGESYLGRDGSGMLDEKFGDGEYLDSIAIMKAQKAAADAGTLLAQNLRYLPVHIIRLRNFVVDGIAFKRWFNPATIKCITFKSGCETKIEIPVPPVFPAPANTATATPIDTNSRLQLVDLKKGKVVNRIDVADIKAGLAADTKPFSALGRWKSTITKNLSLGKDKENKKTAASPAKAKEEKVKKIAGAGAAAATADAGETFVHVDHPVDGPFVPIRSSSLRCFGSGVEYYANEEIEEAKKGKKKAE